MARPWILSLALSLVPGAVASQIPAPTAATNKGLRGDPAAIADAQAMVETMGGRAIWAGLRQLHLVHEWFPWNREDGYIENEVLDFTGPRSRADRKSEINDDIRAYSPEGRFGPGDIPGTRRLEFYGPNSLLGGWVILNARKEPIVKATPVYRYTLGPLQRFGNLRLPAWGVYDNGTTRYQMISATGANQPPNPGLFLPPAEFRH